LGYSRGSRQLRQEQFRYLAALKLQVELLRQPNVTHDLISRTVARQFLTPFNRKLVAGLYLTIQC